MPTNRRTNGPTNRAAEHPAKGAKASEVQKIKGGDSIAIPAIVTPPGGAGVQTTARRLSRLQLAALKERLSERDLSVLQAIQKYRFVSSGQIQELYFINGSTQAANVSFNFLDEVEIPAFEQSVTLEQTYGRRKTA